MKQMAARWERFAGPSTHGAELLAIAAELEAKAEDVRAHGSHWRQPYQAYCYGLADQLAPRKETP
jgi:hypothetical protein